MENIGPELSPEAINLKLEADAAIGGLPPESGPGIDPGPPPVDAETEFRNVLVLPIKAVSRFVLPQWEIQPEEETEFTEATAQCLAQLFPDGVNGKYACWFRLIACSGMIVAMRIAQNGGTLPGIGPKSPDPKPGAANGATAQAA